MEPLHVLNVKRELVVIPRWYPCGKDFLIHRTVENHGWTITHIRSHMAIIQKILTRGKAFKLAAELALLTDKWHLIEDQKSMRRQLNYREQGAVLDLALKVQLSRDWSFR